MAYLPGNKLRLLVAFIDSNKLYADPSNVAITVRSPDGVLTVATYPGDVQKDAAGKYHWDVVINVSGTWYYRWVGGGVVVAAGEASFDVLQTHV